MLERCPTLIVHGTDDRTIPMSHGLGLYDALNDRYKVQPFWVIGKGHNDLDYNFGPLIRKLNAFLEEHLPEYMARKAPNKKRNKETPPIIDQLCAAISNE